jgi:signal peptidase I
MFEYMNDVTPPTPVTSTVPTPVRPGTLTTGIIPPPEEPKKSKKSHLKSILSTVAVLLIAPLLALTITAYVFQSYEVDGPSMQTTLQNHDRLIIWKVARTWSRITGHSYVPNRGDVIVFVKKGLYEDNSNKEKQLIKRVIALPGERVMVKDAKVTVYNSEHPDGFSPDATLPYGKVITTTEGNVDLTVPAGEVFVCGDNRGNSLDSRYFGPIPTHDIVGKLAARILPIGQAEKF